MDSPEELGRHASDRRQLSHALETAQSWLQHAYQISRSMYSDDEPWAIALADAVHHAQESLEKLAQDHAES